MPEQYPWDEVTPDVTWEPAMDAGCDGRTYITRRPVFHNLPRGEITPLEKPENWRDRDYGGDFKVLLALILIGGLLFSRHEGVLRLFKRLERNWGLFFKVPILMILVLVNCIKWVAGTANLGITRLRGFVEPYFEQVRGKRDERMGQQRQRVVARETGETTRQQD